MEALLIKMILFLSTVDGVRTILIILDIARREVTQCGYFVCFVFKITVTRVHVKNKVHI